MRHLAIGFFLAALVAAVIVLGLGARGQGEVAHAGPGDVTLVAIDTDISGNDDSTIGTIEDCKQLANVGDTWTFDLVVQGVDPADKIKGYQIDVDYDPRVIRMGVDDDGDTLFDEDPGGVFADFVDNDGDTQIDEDDNDFIDVDAAASNPPNDVTILSRIASGGGVGFLHLTDTQAAPGSATLSAADGTISPTPPANHEDGEGVLARVTVTAVGTGQSSLLIPSVVQTADVIDGSVDINDDGSINASDDGTLGFDIIDGKMDINNDGSIDASDDGTFAGKDIGNSFGIFDVINGQVDTSDDGSIGAADDGAIQVGGGSDGYIDKTVTAGAGPLNGKPIPVDTFGPAAISVGQPCIAPTPAPTPTPTPSPTPTPTPSPPPGPTPTPGPGAATFNPCSTFAPSDSSPGANSDIVSTFGLGIGADCQAIPVDPNDPPDLWFSAIMDFTPPDWGVARDADVPDGAIVAEFDSIVMLGLIGMGCSNRLFPHFTMMDATTNMTTQVPFFDPEEEFDPPDLNDMQGAEPDDQFDIGSGGLPLGVTRYPDYLTRIFNDPDGYTLTPIARMYGQTEIAGIEASINFVIFEPGTVFVTPAGETIDTDPRLGYPSVRVLQAAGDPDTEPDIEDNNSVSDFCSPIQIDTTVFGVSQDNPHTAANEGGYPVRTNPPDGTYNLPTYAVSQYDADGDGIETPLDPCPLVANPNWDPRLKTNDPNYTGDQDKDSLPDECDPEPNTPGHHDPGGVFDEDYDRYGNRSDNCPLVANSAGQLGGKSEPPASPDDNQRDTDLDGIGDACDPNPNAADGTRFEVCVVSQVTIGAGGPPPESPQNMRPCDANAPLPTPTPVHEELPRTYSATFLCGTSAEDTESAVTPGDYATAVTIHNLQDSPVEFTKRAVLSAGEDEPPSSPTSPSPLTLDPDEALEIDCADIRQLLGLPSGEEFIKGFLIIRSDSAELDVVAVYTAQGLDKKKGSGMSIDVEYIEAKPGPASGSVLNSPATLAGTSFGAALLAVGLTLGASRVLRSSRNGRSETSGTEDEQ